MYWQKKAILSGKTAINEALEKASKAKTRLLKIELSRHTRESWEINGDKDISFQEYKETLEQISRYAQEKGLSVEYIEKSEETSFTTDFAKKYGAPDDFGPGKTSILPNAALGKGGWMLGLKVGNDARITPGADKKNDGIYAAMINVSHRSYKSYPIEMDKNKK